MKLLRNLAVTTVLAALLPVGIAGAGHDHDPDRMQKELGLNDDQAKKVRTIMQEQSDKRRALEEETKKKLATVLNAEQLARMEQHADKRKGRRGDRMGDRIAEEFKLTPEQKAEVEKIFSETRGEHDAMEKSDMNPDQMRSQMESMHARTREKLATVLNAEQLARFDEMHSRHMRYKERTGKHERHSSGAAQKQDTAPGSDAD